MPWEPTEQDYARTIDALNPWHRSGRVPASFAKPQRRPLAEALWRSLARPDLNRYDLVVGPRRVGKTVVMYQTVQRLIEEGIEPGRLWWLHLAHPLLMQLTLDRIVRTLISSLDVTAEKPGFFFLDELTYARDWDLWLKTFYDEQWPIRIVGTSSSTLALRQRRLESGVGRWQEHYLTPCQFSEYLHLRGKAVDLRTRDTLGETIEAAIETKASRPDLKHERQRYMLVGGFPELLMQQSEGPSQQGLFPTEDLASEAFRAQQVLHDEAIQKAVYQDIPQVFGVRNPLEMERLLYTLAGQVAGILSFRKLAGDVGLTSQTLEKYVAYLERSFLVFRVPNYAPKEETIQRRGRKLYFVDVAVRNAALQRGVAPLDDPGEMGLLLENLVASHLHALTQQTGARLYHWRQGTREIDFVYDHPNRPLAFEVTSSTGHRTSGLHAFLARYPRFRGGCYLIYPDARSVKAGLTNAGIGTLPLDLLLLAIGTQANYAMQRRLTG